MTQNGFWHVLKARPLRNYKLLEFRNIILLQKITFALKIIILDHISHLIQKKIVGFERLGKLIHNSLQMLKLNLLMIQEHVLVRRTATYSQVKIICLKAARMYQKSPQLTKMKLRVMIISNSLLLLNCSVRTIKFSYMMIFSSPENKWAISSLLQT